MQLLGGIQSIDFKVYDSRKTGHLAKNTYLYKNHKALSDRPFFKQKLNLG